MQMLSAAARGEEAEAAGGFPDGAPWPGGHTEGLPRSPCQPQTGTRWLSPGLYTDLWGGDTLAPATTGMVCGPAVWASPGHLLQGQMQAPPPGTGLSGGPRWDSQRDRRGEPPGGPVIGTPCSPAAEDLGSVHEK